jgi:hypothetical protein
VRCLTFMKVKEKGDQREGKKQVEPSSHSEEEVVKGKGKGKGQSKEGRGGSKKKAGPSKSRQMMTSK